MKWLIGATGGVLAILAIAAGAAGTDLLNGSPVPMRTTTPVTNIPVATVAPIATKPPAPRVVRIGSPVRNGNLVFTVHGVRRATVVHDRSGLLGWHAGAGGEFVIVRVSVQNLGPEPVFFFTGSQNLVVDGYQFTPELISTSYLNEANDQIQPSLTITRELSFHLIVGKQPQAIMLSDDSFPVSEAAARVELT